MIEFVKKGDESRSIDQFGTNSFGVKRLCNTNFTSLRERWQGIAPVIAVQMANQPPSLFCRIIGPRKEKEKINQGWGKKKKGKKRRGEGKKRNDIGLLIIPWFNDWLSWHTRPNPPVWCRLLQPVSVHHVDGEGRCVKLMGGMTRLDVIFCDGTLYWWWKIMEILTT